jgi:hypothetical protein
MNLHSAFVFCENFYHSHPVASLVIVAVFLLVLFLRTMDLLKIIGFVVLVFLTIYIFSVLGKSSGTGMHSKKQMINQTVTKMD